nr:ral guanine nucleotide dissociation stimulator-like 1 isoform X2 [Nothobranchius furzeri]
MRKLKPTMNPVQEWGEEVEDGVVYGVTLHREPVPSSPPPSDPSAPCSGFVQYRTCKVRRLKAAAVEQLVAHLLEGRNQEQDYGRILLSTYRTFTSTTKLIQLLFQMESASLGLDSSSCSNSCLLTFIQTWLDEYSEDLRDPPLHPALLLLLDHLAVSAAVRGDMHHQPNFCSLAGQAEQMLRTFQEQAALAALQQDEEASADEDSGCENSSDQSSIMDVSAAAIAEQLTRIDSLMLPFQALFIRVVPYQCLGCVWSQRDKKENMSPTIRATVAQFNAVTNRVIMSLLSPPADGTCSSGPLPTTPAQRACIVEKWIKVAQECRRLKNFSSLKAILSALHSNAVHRLRKTWAAVCRDSTATFHNLWETFSDENCVLTNKELLVESTSSGVVPYLGTYLTVLTMLDTALPDTVQGGLINFEKRRREFDVLSQIQTLQTSCSLYQLPHHPVITSWFHGHKLLTDQESYEMSRQLEPPVDSCSPKSWKSRSLSKKLSLLLTSSDGSKKVTADQISVSSSGSSGSEMEDLTSPNLVPSVPPKSFHSSCNNMPDTVSSSSSSSEASCPQSSSPCGTDHCPDRAGPSLGCQYKRSISMNSLPEHNRQGTDSCIIRVSVDLGHDNGNMYKSILVTSQEKSTQVIERALEKHHLEHMKGQDFTLAQVISQKKELLIPDNANVFYAMSTTANFDFVLRQNHKCQKKLLRAAASRGRLNAEHL